ncbi:MAG: hypothetical protein EXS52_00610 [Candidatus Staskawiczbacteria bacterium]|nr:hypothetical protein [Candidatus Staskawiczbacteria bacterium]
MGEINKTIESLSIFIFESIFVSDTVVEIGVIILKVAIIGGITFSAKELAKLRDVLRISLGNHANSLSEEDLSDFGGSMLQVTAVVLKARYLRTKTPLKVQ